MPPVQPMETDRLDTRLRPQLERLRAADLYRVRRVVDGGHGVRQYADAATDPMRAAAPPS